MLIDLRELLSGSQDERIEKVSIESESFDTGIAKYSILEKPEFELSTVSYTHLTLPTNSRV